MGSSSKSRPGPLLDGRYVVGPDVAHRDVEGQIVILSGSDSALFTLNASAALLWPQLVRGCDSGRLAALLARSYGLDREQAASDVEDLLRALVHRQIVVRQRR